MWYCLVFYELGWFVVLLVCDCDEDVECCLFGEEYYEEIEEGGCE